MDKMDNIIDLDKLTPKQTTIRLKKFGTIQIRSFNTKDFIFALNLLEEVEDDKEFTIKLLHQQLNKSINKSINLSEFEKISEKELKTLGREFINNNDYLSKNFTDSEDFFHDFRKSIDIYITTSSKLISSSVSSISNFNNKYSGFKTININFGVINEVAQRMTQVAKMRQLQMSIINNRINKVASSITLSSMQLNSVVNALQLNLGIIKNLIIPQVTIWENWIQQNQNIFNNFNQIWDNFVNTYDIPVKEAIDILKEYQWFIIPSLPIKFIFEIVEIGKKSGNQRLSINDHFYNYFSSNNYEELESIIERWESGNVFKPRRMKIIKTCLSVLQNQENQINASFVIVPTLISQIDAIQTEFMKQKGLYSIKTRWKDNTGNNVSQTDFYKSQNFDEILDSAKDIFINVLYQSTYPGQNLNSPIVFNRHKIMHGENLNYGTKYNSIRTFMILDFLAQIVDGNSQI